MLATGSGGSHRQKILLVDDNRNGLIARKSVLEENGYQATIVDKPEQVLGLVERELFHLIITDYKMPKLTGIELIAQLREAGHKQPIILVSGYVDALGLSEANTGANIVIQKGAHEVPQMLSGVKTLLQMRKPPAMAPQPKSPNRQKRKA